MRVFLEADLRLAEPGLPQKIVIAADHAT